MTADTALARTTLPSALTTAPARTYGALIPWSVRGASAGTSMRRDLMLLFQRTSAYQLLLVSTCALRLARAPPSGTTSSLLPADDLLHALRMSSPCCRGGGCLRRFGFSRPTVHMWAVSGSLEEVAVGGGGVGMQKLGCRNRGHIPTLGPCATNPPC
ncbi:hypothetical protein VM95_11680 [Streptomyces rubellomurinus]|uniref:Uncharacterized protein n=1 Tax=Streptomyces rubellomurinus (strain ATCC 31215) TaxID=359131 RepID=A0A0F2TFR9_STRR3|nr:hypothetical protein VM95_11680 [Streptomyces rubellomurinus]